MVPLAGFYLGDLLKINVQSDALLKMRSLAFIILAGNLRNFAPTLVKIYVQVIDSRWLDPGKIIAASQHAA